MNTIGVQTIVIEAIYNGQSYQVTRPDNEPHEMQIHIEDTFYYRENLLNVAAHRFSDWEYMAWIDAHQMFLEPYWWEDTIWSLEHFGAV